MLRFAFILCILLSFAPRLSAQAGNSIPDSCTTCDVLNRHRYDQISALWIDEFLEIFPELALDEDLQQRIRELTRDPVPINSSGKEDLLSIPGLDPLLAEAIIQHREQRGAFLSLYELQGLKGMNESLFRYLSRVLTLNGSGEVKGSRSWKGEYLLLLHPPARVEGEGLPFRQWHRFKGSYGKHLSFGLSLENDAGEAFRWNSQQKGFDFGTFFMDYRNAKTGWHLIFGDYRVNSAQGLVHGSAGSFGSATWVGRVFQQDNARGYRSSDENLFFRGLFMEKTSGHWTSRAFVSRLRSDGKPTEEGVSESGAGLHRTESEQVLRKQFLRMSAGHSLRYSFKRGELSWQNLVVKDHGKPQYQSSLYHQFTLGSCLFFGEWAYGAYGFSGMQSFVIAPSPKFEISALFRVYPRENHNPYAGGFSSYSIPENERGLYLSAEYLSANKQIWRLYSDWVYRPFPSYLVSTPYWNQTHFLQTESRLGVVLASLRLQWEQGKKDIDQEESYWKRTEIRESDKVRLQLEWKSGPNWIHKSRIEYHFYQHGDKQKGALLFHEIQWRPPLKSYYLILRYTHFSISDYDARIYAYENDVLYAFSVPMFSGTGQRLYLVYRQGLGRNWDFWVKLACSTSGEKVSAKLLLRWSF